ncbi:hypothetical protein, partial [Staphylococcus aureus]|uniref:hypothetical protein n=1 Tax=Staphylococcus aureus TaxID=1280 RepID=UPI0039BE6EA6
MTADTKRDTLLKAISDLGEYGGGKTWRSGTSELCEEVWAKAIHAIERLSPERARRLTVAEVAVLIQRSEKQTIRVLQGPPVKGSFHAEYK